MRKMTPEGYVKQAVMQYLTLKKIFFLRVNSGSMLTEHNGKKRRIAMGEKGTADLLVILGQGDDYCDYPASHKRVYWLEIKSPTGKQSPAQKEFQKQREADGHRYALIRSIGDLQKLGL